MGDDFNERRHRDGPGRRAEDYLYESLVDRLRRLEDRLERSIDKFEEAVRRLSQQQENSEGRVKKRVDDLEDYHISEQATVRTRVAERTKRLERWHLWVGGFSIAGVVIALAALVVTILLHGN